MLIFVTMNNMQFLLKIIWLIQFAKFMLLQFRLDQNQICVKIGLCCFEFDFGLFWPNNQIILLFQIFLLKYHAKFAMYFDFCWVLMYDMSVIILSRKRNIILKGRGNSHHQLLLRLLLKRVINALKLTLF